MSECDVAVGTGKAKAEADSFWAEEQDQGGGDSDGGEDSEGWDGGKIRKFNRRKQRERRKCTMSSQPPYKQVEVEDFCSPDRKAVFTLDTPGDLLMRVEVVGGVSVKIEPSTLMTVAKVMQQRD
jgi:hypothetical protein